VGSGALDHSRSEWGGATGAAGAGAGTSRSYRSL